MGKIAVEKGLAVGPIPLQKATVPVMLKALTQLANDENLHLNARAISAKLTKENGVNEAIRIIEGISRAESIPH